MKIGFDNEKYLKIQSEHIKERISQFDGKLYLELGGKLFDDHHASRVLPGFQPDSKLRMFQKISDSIEIVIVISAADIEKIRKQNAVVHGFLTDADTVITDTVEIIQNLRVDGCHCFTAFSLFHTL